MNFRAPTSFVLLFLAFPLIAGAVEEGVSPDAPPIVDGETLEAPPPQVPPAPGFSGDLRLRLRDTSPRSPSLEAAAPFLRHRPYFYQRGQVRWDDRAAAGWLAIRPSPGPSLGFGPLRRLGTTKGYVEIPDRAILGDYNLSFGQGILFYDQLGESVRPDWVQGRGSRPDLGTMPDAQLRGAAVKVGGGLWSALVFFSRRSLDSAMNEDGTAKDDPWSLRMGTMMLDEGDLARRNTLEEKIAGARGEIAAGPLRTAVTAAGVRYSPGVFPEPSDFNDGGIFRGRRLSLAGVDGSWVSEGWRVAWDAALSTDQNRRGKAKALTLVRTERGVRLWASLFDYDRDFFSPQGKGPSFEVVDPPGSLPANQRGLSIGARRVESWGRWEAEGAWARFPSAMGNGANEDPVFPSQARRWRLESTYNAGPGWDVSLQVQERDRDRYVLPAGASARRQGEDVVRRARLETVWSASPRLRLRIRGDARWERPPFDRRAEGKLMMAEARWSLPAAWSYTARWYAFYSPRAFLTTGFEEIWDGVVASNLAGGMGTLRGASGERYVLIARRRWGKSFSVWGKYDANRTWRGALEGGSRHAWHLQTDFHWQ